MKMAELERGGGEWQLGCGRAIELKGDDDGRLSSLILLQQGSNERDIFGMMAAANQLEKSSLLKCL